VRGWLLALVLLSSIPPVVLTGVIVSRRMANISTRMRAKYVDAGDIVEQTIGTIRTVSLLCLVHMPTSQRTSYQTLPKLTPVWFDSNF
jgi:ABC-type multidrug transport system fused ATPase/permease subunit